MPHAESATETVQVNGDKTSSQFFNHLTSYPVVSDSIATFKSHPYGSKTISVASQASTQAHSLLNPVLASRQAKQASSYIHPYAAKANSVADNSLNTIESHFPLIKQDTATVRKTILGLLLAPVLYPLQTAQWGLDWVNSTWTKERKEYAGQGVVGEGKAVLTTGLTAVGEGASWAREWLAKAEKKGGELADKGAAKAGEVKQQAEKKTNGSA